MKRLMENLKKKSSMIELSKEEKKSVVGGMIICTKQNTCPEPGIRAVFCNGKCYCVYIGEPLRPGCFPFQGPGLE